MKHIAIKAERRDKLSKGQRRSLRESGQILASVFGRELEAVSVTVPAQEVHAALSSETGTNTLIDLTLDGTRHLTRIAKVETDIYSRRLLHVGFQKLKASEPIKAMVPLELVGEPESVQTNTARLEVALRELEVRALPEKMTPSLTHDISEMQPGDFLRAGDITMPDGHELITDPEMSILSVRTGLTGIPTEEEETGETEATEETEAPDAGEGEASAEDSE